MTRPSTDDDVAVLFARRQAPIEDLAGQAGAVATTCHAMAVRFHQGGKLVVSPPRMLFRTRMHASRYAIFQYDVSRDGKRFLINSLPREDAAAPLTLLTNWQAQIGK